MDAQTVIVSVVILAALVYMGRRAYLKLRVFIARNANCGECAVGCGTCGGDNRTVQTKHKLTAQPSPVKSPQLVQLSRRR